MQNTKSGMISLVMLITMLALSSLFCHWWHAIARIQSLTYERMQYYQQYHIAAFVLRDIVHQQLYRTLPAKKIINGSLQITAHQTHRYAITIVITPQLNGYLLHIAVGKQGHSITIQGIINEQKDGSIVVDHYTVGTIV